VIIERLSQVILIIFGLLALIVLTVGLAISCREQPPDSGEATFTPTLPSGATSTPTPLGGVTATATLPGGPTPTATLPGGPTPTATLPGGPTPTATLPGGPTPTATLPGGPTPTATVPGGPTPTATPTAPGGLIPGTTVQHVVSRGEWLLQIARCYGASYSAVRAANWLPNPDYILPGQVLTIPNIGSQGRIIGPPCVQAHAVEAGETWESMATRFGTTTAILRRANPGELSVGRIIWAPRP